MLRLLALALGLLLPVPPALAQPVTLRAVLVAEGLSQPVFATAPAGDPRLFIVEQTGRIRILADGAVAERPFLDLSGAIRSGGERGLLGLAFHPDYAASGRFFVNYTGRDGATEVVAYTVSADPDLADPASAVPVLRVAQPFGNHNGGWIGFGPDGYLYIGMGDGGSGGDPQGHGQNPDSLLGKILRIDVDGGARYAIPPGNPFAAGGGAPEIFALGLRNPWRNAFDGGDLYIADVGQGAWEEVTVIGPGEAGANLGWAVMEGQACFRRAACDRAGLTPPVHVYSHAEGCSITGGYVYRGAAIPEIAGHYFFADFCSGRVWSFRYRGGEASGLTQWTALLGRPQISSFGLDGAGEMYMTTLDGRLWRIAR